MIKMGRALISAALVIAASDGLSAPNQIEHGAGYGHGGGGGSSDAFGPPILAIIAVVWIYFFFKFLGFALDTLTDANEFKRNWFRLFLAGLGLFSVPVLVLCIGHSLNRSGN